MQESSVENMAQLYESFMGFERQENEEKIKAFFKKMLVGLDKPCFKQGRKKINIRILSIGTGYGRIEIPFFHSYIQWVLDKAGREIDASREIQFDIICVEPQPSFLDKLNSELDYFRKNIKQTRAKNKFRVLTDVKAKTLGEIDFRKKPFRVRFHCVIGILSMQFETKLKTVFPLLLQNISPEGILLIGDADNHGKWVSTPPKKAERPVLKEHILWYEIWRRWHGLLRENWINNRLRIFTAHDSSVLVNTAIDTGFRNISEKSFSWNISIDSAVLKQVFDNVRDGKWKISVSSLYVEDLHKAKIILDELEEQFWSKIDEGKTIEFCNGLRFHLLQRDPKTSDSAKDNLLQKSVLRSSHRNLQNQGLHWYAELVGEKQNLSRTKLLEHLTRSLSRHLEIENGSFVVGLSVNPHELSAPHACSAGHLVPFSTAAYSDQRIEDTKEYFSGLACTDEIPLDIAGPRVWLWVYTIYVVMGYRMSVFVETLRRNLELSANFTCAIGYGGNKELIDYSSTLSQLFFSLEEDKAKELRKTIWSFLNENCQITLSEVCNWSENSDTVGALNRIWGKNSPVIKYLERTNEQTSHDSKQEDTPYSFYPGDDGVIASDDKGLMNLLLNSDLLVELKKTIESWKTENIGIEDGSFKSITLKRVFSEERYDWDDVLLTLYICSLFVSEKGLRYIFHIPAAFRNMNSYWAGWHIFLDYREFSVIEETSYKKEGAARLNELFDQFIAPFDLIQYQNIISPEVESLLRIREIESRNQTDAHETNYILGLANLLLDYVTNLPTCNEKLNNTVLEYVRSATRVSSLRLLKTTYIPDNYVFKPGNEEEFVSSVFCDAWQMAIAKYVDIVTIDSDSIALLGNLSLPPKWFRRFCLNNTAIRPSEQWVEHWRPALSRWLLAAVANAVFHHLVHYYDSELYKLHKQLFSSDRAQAPDYIGEVEPVIVEINHTGFDNSVKVSVVNKLPNEKVQKKSIKNYIEEKQSSFEPYSGTLSVLIGAANEFTDDDRFTVIGKIVPKDFYTSFQSGGIFFGPIVKEDEVFWEASITFKANTLFSNQ